MHVTETLELEHYLHQGMKVKHLYSKISRVCSRHLNSQIKVIYLRSFEQQEIIDNYLLDKERSLEFLQNKDTIIAMIS